MDRNIKLIWDFRGPEAHEIAKHHAIHLDEFAAREKIDLIASGVDAISEVHHIAYMVVKEPDMIAVRDALKPHRGQVYEG
ncbi:MAG: hypothetical protein AAGB22_03825 [Bacteroidota bacterium]